MKNSIYEFLNQLNAMLHIVHWSIQYEILPAT